MRNIRERLAEAIDDNGGYDEHSLSYNVGLYHCKHSFDSLEKIIKRQRDPDFEFFLHLNDERLQHLVYENAEKDVRASLEEGNDCYREYPTSVMVRHGFATRVVIKDRIKNRVTTPYIPADHFFQAEYGLYGRGGKHLCIESFDGKKLPHNLADLLREPEECRYHGFTNRWCRRLLAATEMWDEDFTCKRASEAVDDAAAWHLYSWNLQALEDAQNRALVP